MKKAIATLKKYQTQSISSIGTGQILQELKSFRVGSIYLAAVF